MAPNEGGGHFSSISEVFSPRSIVVVISQLSASS
jgi:hypothetical protein